MEERLLQLGKDWAMRRCGHFPVVLASLGLGFLICQMQIHSFLISLGNCDD